MSSFALKGFVTGLAKGALAQFDKEKEETEENIKLSVKNAYENMSRYKSVVEKQQEDIKERDRRIMQFAPDLEDSYRIAAATMPDLLTVYQTLLDRGQRVNIRDLIQVGEQAKGLKFDTWVNGLKNLQAQQQQVGAFIAPKEDSFFAPSAERQERMSERLAKSLGTTTEELARFKTEQTAPSLTGYGSFTPKFLDKLVRQQSIDDRLTDVRGQYAQVASEKGEDSPEAKALFDLNNKLTIYKNNLDPKEATWASRMDALRIKYADAKLAGKIGEMSDIEKQMNAHLEAYKKSQPVTEKETQESLSSLLGAVNAKVSFAVRERHGDLWAKEKITQNKEGQLIFGGLDQNIQRDVQVTEQLATIDVLSAWIVGGKPINDRVATALRTRGIKFDSEGKIIIPSRGEQPSPTPQEAPSGGAKPVPLPGSFQQPPAQGVPRNPISEKAGPATPSTQRSFTEDPSTWSEEKGFLRDPDGEWVEPSKDPKTGAILIDPRTGKPRYTAYRKGRNPDLPMIGSKEILAYAYKNQISYAEAYRELVTQQGYGTNGT